MVHSPSSTDARLPPSGPRSGAGPLFFAQKKTVCEWCWVLVVVRLLLLLPPCIRFRLLLRLLLRLF